MTLLTGDNSMKDQLLNIRIDLNSSLIPEKDVPYFMKMVLKCVLTFSKISSEFDGR